MTFEKEYGTMAEEKPQPQPQEAQPQKPEERSLTGSAAVELVMHLMDGAVAGAGGAAGARLVNQVLSRPPKEEPAAIVLPPGVDPPTK